MKYIKDIKGANTKGLTLSFDFNNDYYVDFEINGEYRTYKIYSSCKGYYMNFKNRRYYLGFTF